MLSLLNVKGAKMYVGGGFSPFGDSKVDRDHLLVPEVMAEDFSSDCGKILKPSLDAIWNACGYSGSSGYGTDGQRKPKR